MKTKKNADLDEQAEGVSFEKGREFEKKFATFLKDELGWDKVRVGAHMTGRNNAKGTSIDVFGERLDAVGIKYNKISNNWMLASGFLAALAIIWFVADWGSNGLWLFLFGMGSMISGCVFKIISINNHKRNAWSECKNLKTRVNINHMSKMLREYKDFKESKNEDYRFTDLYFASANGYVENALKMAMDNGIVCYTKKGRTFIEEKYWDETKK